MRPFDQLAVSVDFLIKLQEVFDGHVAAEAKAVKATYFPR